MDGWSCYIDTTTGQSYVGCTFSIRKDNFPTNFNKASGSDYHIVLFQPITSMNNPISENQLNTLIIQSAQQQWSNTYCPAPTTSNIAGSYGWKVYEYQASIDVIPDGCGFCEMQVTLADVSESPNAQLLTGWDYWGVACYPDNYASLVANNQQVVGIVAMAQADASGTGIYDGFFGAFEMQSTNTTGTFSEVYSLDFFERNPTKYYSLFAGQPYFDF